MTRVKCACLAAVLALVLGGSWAAPRAGSSSALAGLSLRQLAGERVIAAYRGLEPPGYLLGMLRAGEVAGVIFFRDNIASRDQLRAVTRQLQAAADRSPVKKPLLLMTDQEGGPTRSLDGPPLLSQKQIGASPAAVASARQAGHGAATNLRAVGLHVNLAPVLDVYRAPGNFIDGDQRSYGSSAVTVARLGATFVVAQQQAGVAAAAKHFPGLGAATVAQNTDRRPVTLRVSLAALRAVDELPYRAAIRAGVRLVMVSWATYPALDPDRPAGLSARVVRGELRGRLGFTGVTLSDSLDARGLRAYGYSVGHRAVLAARAGIDLILCTGSDDEGAVVNALAAAQAGGEISARAATAAAARVLALRSSLAP
jgi:beta-N-acetylhexosaminidase